jgi:hypothetical protein
MTIQSNSVTITVTAPTPVLSSIKLTASVTNITTGEAVTFTATAYDQNGNPMSGISLTLVDTTTGTNIPMGTTDSSGVVSVSAGFNQSGTYVLYAED